MGFAVALNYDLIDGQSVLLEQTRTSKNSVNVSVDTVITVRFDF